MSGAGTTSVAWTREDSFRTAPSSPTYLYPGRDVSVQDITLSNALARSRLPDDNEAIEALSEQLEGALSLEYDLTHPWALTDAFVSEHVEDAEAGTVEWSMGRGQMPTSRWFVGVDVASATCERELEGAATTQYQLQISQGGNVRVTQTIVYASEQENTSLTPGDVVGGDEGPYQFSGATLTVDGSDKKKMQSATLEITNGGTLDRGWSREAVDAVAGDADYTLNVSKIITESVSDNVALAYGESGATEPIDDGCVDGVSGEIPIERCDGDTITFGLEGVRPNTYGWDNIPPSGDERAQESIEMFVDRVTATADVSMEVPF